MRNDEMAKRKEKKEKHLCALHIIKVPHKTLRTAQHASNVRLRKMSIFVATTWSRDSFQFRGLFRLFSSLFRLHGYACRRTKRLNLMFLCLHRMPDYSFPVCAVSCALVDVSTNEASFKIHRVRSDHSFDIFIAIKNSRARN